MAAIALTFQIAVIDIGAHILCKYSALGVKKVLDLDPIQNLDCPVNGVFTQISDWFCCQGAD